MYTDYIKAPFSNNSTYALLFSLRLIRMRHINPWPSKIDNLAGTEEVQIIIQINGKLRGKINVKAGLGKEEVLKIAEEDQKIKDYIADSSISKVIFVPNKLINLVI